MSNNRFKNGYTCKICLESERSNQSVRSRGYTMTPVYFRIDQKFVFAGYVNCPDHGISEAIALRDL